MHGSWKPLFSTIMGVPGARIMGVPGARIMETTVQHLIAFAMREDGFEFDEWIMTTDPNLEP